MPPNRYPLVWSILGRAILYCHNSAEPVLCNRCIKCSSNIFSQVLTYALLKYTIPVRILKIQMTRPMRTGNALLFIILWWTEGATWWIIKTSATEVQSSIVLTHNILALLWFIEELQHRCEINLESNHVCPSLRKWDHIFNSLHCFTKSMCSRE